MYENFETNNYRCMVNPNTGHIIAYNKSAQHYKIELFITDKVNPFSYTDEDYIISKAKELINKNKLE